MQRPTLSNNYIDIITVCAYIHELIVSPTFGQEKKTYNNMYIY